MTKDLFQGVFAMDQLPATCHGMYVVNANEQEKPGEHWLAVNDKEYFDLYGLPPQDERLIEMLGSYVVYNAVPLQQVMSNVCGFYCVYHLLGRA